MKISRRIVLKGLGGATLGLPLLESFADSAPAFAQTVTAANTFAIFFRQANGVARASGSDPERFWPTAKGALTAGTVSGRALEELNVHLPKMLVLANVRMNGFAFGDGHAAGALQALTARGPTVENAAGNSEAGGESIDHRIGRELNPGGRDSLFLYAGAGGGWLGGPCISYRGPAMRRSATPNPMTAFQQITGTGGGSGGPQAEAATKRKSVNDLVRAQLTALRSHPRLSQGDKDRLDLHLTSVRDLELALTCSMSQAEQTALQGMSTGYGSTDGDLVLNAARAHMRVAALAVACGYTRSVAIQVGAGNDAATRYRRLDNGQLMENYHYISHRVESHGSSGTAIPEAHMLHGMVDRHFARTFKYLLDTLAAYPTADGQTMLDKGVCAWYNDNSDGPPHAITNIPWVLAGSCSGYFKQGQYLDVQTGTAVNHSKLLNTILTAVGVRKPGNLPVDNFGDPTLPTGLLPAIAA
ncbi:MAG: DUF1552 domain-containing protein [Myxococcaceae bacterium]|nr:DUF1552 domain-containing protein [Myxococcaceae bacterium]